MVTNLPDGQVERVLGGSEMALVGSRHISC